MSKIPYVSGVDTVLRCADCDSVLDARIDWEPFLRVDTTSHEVVPHAICAECLTSIENVQSENLLACVIKLARRKNRRKLSSFNSIEETYIQYASR